MTTIPPQPPPPPPPPPPPGGPPRPLPSVIVSNPPATLTSLPAGTPIEATVATEAGKATVQISTVYGSLQIQTTLPLEKGSILNLVLQSLTPQVQLQIATINGKVPHIALRGLEQGPLSATMVQTSGSPALQQPGTGLPATGLAATAGQGVNSLVGTTIIATILRPAALPASVPATPAGPAAIAVGPNAASPGTTGTPPVGPVAVPANAIGTRPAVPAGPGTQTFGAGMVTQSSWPLAQGTQVPVQVTAIKLPGPTPPALATAPQTTLAPPALGQTITATVTGTTSTGRPIMQTAMGPMTLLTSTALPRGTEVILEFAGQPILPDAAKSAPLAARPQSLFRAQDWPGLKEAFQVLQEANPAMAQHLAASVLPRADTQLAANILFLLAALRGGDVANWLGNDALRVLQRERPNLTARLRDEFREIGSMASKPMTGDWRIALIPFFNGSDIDQARLFLRPYGGDDPEDEGLPKGTRFIIDVDLSRFSRLQLDGLVRERKKRLDLIVRSEQPLPTEMQNDIRTIFREANELTGIDGGLTFQAAPPNFVEIVPDEDSEEGSDLIA